MTTGLLTTTAGRAAIIADLGGGTDLVLTHVAWGDASGVPYTPNEAQTALVNERYRATIASVAVVDGAIVVDAVIPADTADGLGRPSHGFNVAEVGLFSSAGTLIGLARCGNGYKPPPSSGQATAATWRLKLAVANPSAITVVTDPQAQIIVGRHVRPFFMTIDGVLNAPPAAPALGATYIVGADPTGAWTGFAHRIAQWVGVWSLVAAPVGHHVVDQSKGLNASTRWLERTAGGWVPGLTRLLQRQPFNYVVSAGTANALTVTLDPVPASYNDIIGMPLRVGLQASNTAGATINVNGLGPKGIVRSNGVGLQPGDLLIGRVVELVYEGTYFQITSSSIPPADGTAVFTANGTFVVPAGVTRLKRVRLWGAGGGGGGSRSAGSAGSAGASGGYCEGSYAVTPGQSIAVTIGSGGAAGNSAAPSNGVAGGSTSLGSLISSTGGGGGFTGFDTVYSGPYAAGGIPAGSGPLAVIGGIGGYGTNISASVGLGGVTQGDIGRSGGALSSGIGAPGVFPGGGGGGGANGENGGTGAPGLIIIDY